jgi:hypothetical protein
MTMTDLLVDLSSWALGKTSCAGAIGYRRWLGGGSKQPDRLPNDPRPARAPRFKRRPLIARLVRETGPHDWSPT